MIPKDVFAVNKKERIRLETMAGKLTPEQLSQPMDAGWKVTGVLAHLAFWDIRAFTLIRKWKTDGITPSAIDVDVTNEATRTICNAVSPAGIGALAVSAAISIDEEIESLTPEFFALIEEKGTTVRLDRAAHRKLHLDEISQALGIS